MVSKERKRNTPIATLIKNYINKKSGKVPESRKEIQRRFDYLDWKDQKKIMQAFLESGKADRLWAYSKLLDNWDKSFEPRIKELWEQSHEGISSWVVIRYFPTKYLSQNIDKFTDDRDYYFICLRLAEDKSYIIDRSKLSITDYLSVLYHTGRPLSDYEARDLLYKTVHDVCTEDGDYPQLAWHPYGGKDYVIGPILFQDVNLAVYYLRKMNLTDVVHQFERWNEGVQSAIFDSPDFKTILNTDMIGYEIELAKVKVAMKYAYLALDDKYKTEFFCIDNVQTPHEWFKENAISEEDSSANKLIEDLGLDINVNEDTLPF